MKENPRDSRSENYNTTRRQKDEDKVQKTIQRRPGMLKMLSLRKIYTDDGRNDQHDDNECSCATVFASLLCLFSSEHDTAMMQWCSVHPPQSQRTQPERATQVWRVYLYLPFSASLPLSLARCMTAEPHILSCLPLPGWLALIFSPSFYIFLKIYSRITWCIEICLNVQCHIYPLCVQQCVKVVFMGLIPSPVSRKKTIFYG